MGFSGRETASTAHPRSREGTVRHVERISHARCNEAAGRLQGMLSVFIIF